jgi:DNA-binding response OmpR family regulator
MKKMLIGTNILIVEDDPILLELICDYFSMTGATVFQAVNGQLAFQIIESNSIDLVLSDVQMPVMNGFELLKKIRANNSSIPFVLLVTGQCELTENDALTSGASGLVHKPFKLNELNEKIHQLLLVAKSA